MTQGHRDGVWEAGREYLGARRAKQRHIQAGRGRDNQSRPPPYPNSLPRPSNPTLGCSESPHRVGVGVIQYSLTQEDLQPAPNYHWIQCKASSLAVASTS